MNIGPKLKVHAVLKWKDIYIENTTAVLLMASIKMEGVLKLGLKSQGPPTLYIPQDICITIYNNIH